jgi:chromosome partitioning protein
MSNIFAVVNQKGGVGKTTTCVNIAAELVQAGKRVLVVDADPQSNATSGLGIDKGTVERGLYDVIVDHVDVSDVLLQSVVGLPGLDLVPSSLDLSGAEMSLYSEPVLKREFVLSDALGRVAPNYDFVLIDGPPSLGLLTINILVAANRLLIPIQCEYYALEGISQLLTVIDGIRNDLNKGLEIGMVVLTMQDGRTNLSQQVIDEVRSFFGSRVAKTSVPRNVRLSEAPSFGKPISLYDPRSRGAIAYHELAKELMELT